MSALHDHNLDEGLDEYVEDNLDPDTGRDAPEAGAEPAPERETVVVRRNGALSAVVGVAASALAIGYLWRAVQYGAPLDWLLCLAIALVAGLHLSALLDARTPLVVADDLGVRIRLGTQWRGLPWDAVADLDVQPRAGRMGDGRLVFHPHQVERVLDGLDAPGRRTARLNERLYGAPLVVPLGLTTRSSVAPAELPEALTRLAGAQVTVTTLPPRTPDESDQLVEPDAPTDPTEQADRSAQPAQADPSADRAADPEDESIDEPAATRAPRRNLLAGFGGLGGLGTVVSRIGQGRDHDVDVTGGVTGDVTGDATGVDEPAPGPAGPAAEPVAPAAHAVPLREARRGLRAMVTRDQPATTLGATALVPEERGPRSVDLDREPGPSVSLLAGPGGTAGTVRPIARLGDPVEPLVLDDLRAAPAPDPVIGPQLAAARTRVGLSVDELAERTRIRPHVIESIEVDDFTPCGGDFYARGHLRTLARVLGQDPAPLLEKYDNRYATAPINARRVFEAELATGMTGSMRSTVGGPNWALLVGCVLSLVLVWGVVRLFSTDPGNVDESLLPGATPVLNGSAGVDREFPTGGGRAEEPVRPRLPVTLVAAQAPTRVVVRDGDGQVVFAGPLVMGERKTLRVSPPVTVRAGNAGAVEVRVQGRDRGAVGELGTPGRRTFHRVR